MIGSAVVPTLIAGIAFLHKHLLPEPVRPEPAERVYTEVQENGLGEEG